MSNPKSIALRAFATEPYNSLDDLLASKAVNDTLIGQRLYTKNGHCVDVVSPSANDYDYVAASGTRLKKVESYADEGVLLEKQFVVTIQDGQTVYASDDKGEAMDLTKGSVIVFAAPWGAQILGEDIEITREGELRILQAYEPGSKIVIQQRSVKPSSYADAVLADFEERVGAEADRAEAAAATSGARYVKDADEFFATDVDEGLWLSYEGYSWEVTSSGGRFPHPVSGKGVQPFQVPEGHSVRAHGAISGGSVDESEVMVYADASAEADGVPLVIDTVIRIAKYLDLGAPKMMQTKGRVILSRDFEAPDPSKASGRYQYAAFHNKNWATSFNAGTARTIEVEGVDFLIEKHITNPTHPMQGVFGFGNAIDCKFKRNKVLYEEGMTFTHPLIVKMMGGVKGLNVDWNTVRVTASNGGIFWMQGYSGSPSDEAGASERITFNDNDVEQYGGAEAFSAWGAGGIIQDFEVCRNRIKTVGVPVPVSILASLNAAATVGVTRRGKIEDNNFEFLDVSTHGMVVGNTYLSDQITGISIRKNRIRASAATGAVANGYVIRVRESVPGVDIDDNIIEAIGDLTFQYGIAGNGANGNVKVRRNNVKGQITIGISAVAEDVENDVTAISMASHNCRDVILGVKRASIPIRRLSGTSYTRHRYINPRLICTNETSTTQVVYVTGDCDVEMDGIEAYSNNSSARGVLLQGTGVRKLRNSKFLGVGSGLSGQLAEAFGNELYGVKDSEATASGSIPITVRDTYPIGYMVRDAAPAIASDKIRLGWVLRLDGSSRVWTAVNAAIV